MYEQNEGARTFALKYCNYAGGNWGMGGKDCTSNIAVIKTLIQSSAGLVVIPMQDILGYGGDTRMNIPGVAEGNWRFRIANEQLGDINTHAYFDLNNTYGRLSD